MKTVSWLLCWFAMAGAVVASAESLPAHVDVFASGTEGYHTIRIPAIVTAADGSLLAFAEGRKDNREDPGGGDIDLVYKRSTDQGASWSKLMVLDDPGAQWAASNPTPVLDRSNGRLWVVYNRWEPAFGTAESKPGTANNQAWVRHSDDHGRSWSPATDITKMSRHFEEWGAMFLGPGGAIQTRNGRLIVPAAMKPDTYAIWTSVGDFLGSLNFLRAYVLYSDDHGATWRRGALLKALTNENQVVELADGAIMMDARQSSGNRRWIVISSDGGESWSAPVPGQAVTAVATSIERYTSKAHGDDRDRILWTGPAGPGRKNLVIRVSYDEAQTFAKEKVIYGGLAAYSDISILKDKSIGVLWERGVSQNYQFITFTRVKREYLEEAP